MDKKIVEANQNFFQKICDEKGVENGILTETICRILAEKLEDKILIDRKELEYLEEDSRLFREKKATLNSIAGYLGITYLDDGNMFLEQVRAAHEFGIQNSTQPLEEEVSKYKDELAKARKELFKICGILEGQLLVVAKLMGVEQCELEK